LIGGIISECKVTGNSKISASAGYSGGLIGHVIGGEITACSSSCKVWGGQSSKSLGGLIGELKSKKGCGTTMLRCTSSGDISVGGGSSIGGLIGYLEAEDSGIIITKCSSVGNVFSTGTVLTSFGGLIGNLNSATVENCFSTGTILNDENSLINAYYVGGLIGYCTEGTITDCYHIEGKVGGENGIGGLIGFVNNKDYFSKIERSFASNLNVNGQTNVGGLIGRFNEGATKTVTVSQCFANTSVNGSTYNVGGLIGFICNASVTDCYSVGKVEGSESIGGLIGYVNDGNSTVSYCYSVATVISKSSKNYGELIGYINSPTANGFKCDNSYYLEDEVNSSYGQGKSKEQLKDRTTYTGWNILDTNTLGTRWWIDSKIANAINDGFPYLANIKYP